MPDMNNNIIDVTEEHAHLLLHFTQQSFIRQSENGTVLLTGSDVDGALNAPLHYHPVIETNQQSFEEELQDTLDAYEVSCFQWALSPVDQLLFESESAQQSVSPPEPHQNAPVVPQTARPQTARRTVSRVGPISGQPNGTPATTSPEPPAAGRKTTGKRKWEKAPSPPPMSAPESPVFEDGKFKVKKWSKTPEPPTAKEVDRLLSDLQTDLCEINRVLETDGRLLDSRAATGPKDDRETEKGILLPD